MSESNKNLGIIFDVDGVLIDSTDIHYRAFQRIGKDLGVEFSKETLMKTSGMHNNQIFPLWLQRDCSLEELKNFADTKETYYRELAKKELKPVSGVLDLVKNLHAAGFKLAVGSSGPKANVDLALDTLGVRSYFQTVITGSDVTHGKPNPEIFLKGAKGLNLPSQSCLVFEDAANGVQAAKAAQMSVIAITTTLPSALLKDAHHVINSFSEVNPDFCAKLIKKNY